MVLFPILEICCFSSEAAIKVVNCRFDFSDITYIPRLELCQNREMDGLTPDIASVLSVINARNRCKGRTVVHTMLRPMPKHPLMIKIDLLRSENTQLSKLLANAAPFLWHMKKDYNLIEKSASDLINAGSEGLVIGYLDLVFLSEKPTDRPFFPISSISSFDLSEFLLLNNNQDTKKKKFVSLSINWNILIVVFSLCKKYPKNINITFHRAIDVLFQQELYFCEEMHKNNYHEMNSYLPWSFLASELINLQNFSFFDESVRSSDLRKVSFLTSGGPKNTIDGLNNIYNVIDAMIRIQNGIFPKITVMCGGGVNDNNITQIAMLTLRKYPNITWAYHGSLLGKGENVPSHSSLKNAMSCLSKGCHFKLSMI